MSSTLKSVLACLFIEFIEPGIFQNILPPKYKYYW